MRLIFLFSKYVWALNVSRPLNRCGLETSWKQAETSETLYFHRDPNLATLNHHSVWFQLPAPAADTNTEDTLFLSPSYIINYDFFFFSSANPPVDLHPTHRQQRHDVTERLLRPSDASTHLCGEETAVKDFVAFFHYLTRTETQFELRIRGYKTLFCPGTAATPNTSSHFKHNHFLKLFWNEKSMEIELSII